jgi:3-oxoacyl-(acyl-carrier-protein) synthase/acyl carrier protein
MHPALLDGVFQLAGFVRGTKLADSWVPAACRESYFYQSDSDVLLQATRYVWAYASVVVANAKLLVVDFKIWATGPTHQDIQLISDIRGFHYRILEAQPQKSSLYEIHWSRAELNSKQITDGLIPSIAPLLVVVVELPGFESLPLKPLEVSGVSIKRYQLGQFSHGHVKDAANVVVAIPFFESAMDSSKDINAGNGWSISVMANLIKSFKFILESFSGQLLHVTVITGSSQAPHVNFTLCREAISGLVQTARLECSTQHRIHCIDIGADLHSLITFNSDVTPALVDQLYSGIRKMIDVNTQAFRCSCGTWNMPLLRLSQTASERIGTLSQSKYANQTALITGGLGGLGLLTAETIAKTGVSCIVLASRSGTIKYAGQGLEELLQALQEGEAGVRVEVERCDTADEEDVAALLCRIRKNHGPLRIVVHAAGVLSDSMLANQNADTIQHVWGPKADGAWFLHKHTLGDDLSAFMLYSSIASLFGNIGQVNYSAANAYLDGLARWRVAQGLPAVSVQWPAVSGVGMAAAMDERVQITNNMSIDGPMVRRLMSQLMCTMALAEPVQVVLPRGLLEPGSLPPCLTSLLNAVTTQPETTLDSKKRAMKASQSSLSNVSSAVTARWIGKSAVTLHTEVQSMVVTIVVGLLGCAPEDLNADEPLMEAGLDSLAVTQLVRELAISFELNLSPTLLFDHPTINALTSYLCGTVSTSDDTRSSYGEQVATTSHLGHSALLTTTTSNKHEVAIVGMSCRFPGGIEGPAMFWDALKAGTNCITKVPLSRWDVDALVSSDATITRDVGQRIQWGGFIEDLELFDAGFFRISPAEASAMDPQQRLLLEYACLAFEDAGCPKGSLEGQNVGVFVGMTASDLASEDSVSSRGVYAANGSAISAAVGRISYHFGLQGPCTAYDTACSSALVALHAAVRYLQVGDCDIALCAAVSSMLSSHTSVATAAANMTSPTGRCHTFDESADGYARSEGCGAVLLKRLQDALTDVDHIYAVVNGVGVAQDGRSASLTAPNGKAQEKLLQSTLRDSGLTGGDVDYIEAHGTGTALGDPIEMGALNAVMNIGCRGKPNPLTVGAAKACVGHLEPAAGIVGLIKAVLLLQVGQAPGNPELRSLNSKLCTIDINGSVSIPVTMAPLSMTRVGINSFGYAGTIAHTVLRQLEGVFSRTQTECQHRLQFKNRRPFPWKPKEGRSRGFRSKIQFK